MEVKMENNYYSSGYKTMDEEYGDGSEHVYCPICKFCITCGDCEKYGCGKEK